MQKKEMNTKRSAVISILLVLLFLMMGMFCYALFNQRTILGSFLPRIDFAWPDGKFFAVIRTILTSYAADLCWAAAFPLALQVVLTLRGKKQLWLIGCLSLGMAYEAMQGAGVLPGTFDWFDFIAYALGTACSLYIIKTIWR